jgi:hypothetical protein
MDFMSPRLLDGRWFRVLTVIDQFTREYLALTVDSHLVALFRRWLRSAEPPNRSPRTTAANSPETRVGILIATVRDIFAAISFVAKFSHVTHFPSCPGAFTLSNYVAQPANIVANSILTRIFAARIYFPMCQRCHASIWQDDCCHWDLSLNSKPEMIAGARSRLTVILSG